MPSLKLTAKAPENRPKRPKRKRESIPTIHFQGQTAVSFREGTVFFLASTQLTTQRCCFVRFTAMIAGSIILVVSWVTTPVMVLVKARLAGKVCRIGETPEQ